MFMVERVKEEEEREQEQEQEQEPFFFRSQKSEQFDSFWIATNS